jgi:hypothetical protein
MTKTGGITPRGSPDGKTIGVDVFADLATAKFYVRRKKLKFKPRRFPRAMLPAILRWLAERGAQVLLFYPYQNEEVYVVDLKKVLSQIEAPLTN